MEHKGTFVQLDAFGASDVLFCSIGVPAKFTANNRDAMMYYFIERPDGFPVKEDVPFLTERPNILDHVPASKKPTTEINNNALSTYSIQTEKTLPLPKFSS